MKRTLLIWFVLLLLLLPGAGCILQDKPTNWNIQYSAKSKDPYGFYLMNEVMPDLFPKARIKHIPINSAIFSASTQAHKSAYILLAESVAFSTQQLEYLDNWLYEGNDVVMIMSEMGAELKNALPLSIHTARFEGEGLLATAAVKPIHDTVCVYRAGNTRQLYTVARYPYPIFASYFSLAEGKSSSVQVLATDVNGHPNAVAMQVGAGRLILVATPLAFSNYFLKASGNRAYLEDIMAYVSPETEQVFWSIAAVRQPSSSDWRVLWEHKTTRAAILLSILGLTVYVLFGLKRKQRIIPQVQPLTNDAASFVETIAGLYYNTRNNNNLAQKMVQHFMEYIRNTYQLNTGNTDDDFARKLSMRSGVGLEETRYVLIQTRQVMENSVNVNDTFLHSLYKNIQRFYKK